MQAEPCPPAAEIRYLKEPLQVQSLEGEAPGYAKRLATTAFGLPSLRRWCLWIEPVPYPAERWSVRWRRAVDSATPTHTPAFRWIRDRFDPEAPASEARQTEGRGGEAFGVTRGFTLQGLNLQGLLQVTDFSSGRTGLSLHQAAGRPTPRAINVASIGIEAKPISSMLMIQLRRPARASLTLGSSPLRSGIAQRM